MSFLYFFDIAGTFAFAVSGALVGAERRMDIYGMFVLALVTGIGGGTVRDMMLGRFPPFVFSEFGYLAAIIVATFLVFFMKPGVTRNKGFLDVMDALGLGVFTCIGTVAAVNAGVGWYGTILFGVITATVGGMIRDVLAHRVPFVLQREIYASASIAGGALFITFELLGTDRDVNMAVTSAFVTCLRLVSLYKGWNLPRILNR